jgi:endoglucanase
MLRVRGDKLVDGEGKVVTLRGIGFGNEVWADVVEPRTHHSESDYGQVKRLGMNTVRFYMNAVSFQEPSHPEEFRASGWSWLDDNVAWAKKHGIRLILNLHVPEGGYLALGEGRELWESPEVQQRFIQFWVALASRYRNEPTIAGYDLLSEPAVTSSIDQWKSLANRTISAIRAVDPQHVIFIERVSAVGRDWAENAERNFFLVDDPNVVYEFHFYKPFHFTHQSAPWVDYAAEETRYPNPEGVGVEWFNLELSRSVDGPRLPPGNSDWRLYRGSPIPVTNSAWVVGRPVLACSRNSGKVWFDELVLEELDPKGQVKRVLWSVDMSSRRGWYYWSADGSGLTTEETDGHATAGSVAMSGSRAEANLSAEPLQIRLEQQSIYRLSGWMKGQGISKEAVCQPRFDLYASRVPVLPIDRSYLASELDAYLAFGKAHQVPMFLGEFGAIRDSFEHDRGGARWVSDMLELLDERSLHFTYHDYHEAYMGLFYGDGTLPEPTNANQQLLELFRTKLGGSAL